MGVSTWTDMQDQTILDGLKADQTYTQIATALGVSKAMVSGRLYRLRKLRPDDVPEKKLQFVHRTRKIPQAGTLPPKMLARKNARIERAMRRDDQNAAERAMRAITRAKPAQAPVPFMALARGQCTWCVQGEADATMMCCAAEVIDVKQREGDRRATHCAYHYELSLARPRK